MSRPRFERGPSAIQFRRVTASAKLACDWQFIKKTILRTVGAISLCQFPVVLIESLFRGFPQLPQADSGIVLVPDLGYNRLRLNPLNLIRRHTT
jgi:hypothetical protein